MAKDLQYLMEYRSRIADNLSMIFNTSLDNAERIISELEAANILKIEAPSMVERPVELITNNGHLSKTELGMTSHKSGNVILNARKDWKNIFTFILGLVETGVSINGAHPIMIITGIVGCIISASKLTDIEISANGTAIILILQKHKENRTFAVSEEQCQREANEILSLNGYKEMDNSTFQAELTKLYLYKCIAIDEQMIELRETVLFPY